MGGSTRFVYEKSTLRNSILDLHMRSRFGVLCMLSLSLVFVFFSLQEKSLDLYQPPTSRPLAGSQTQNTRVLLNGIHEVVLNVVGAVDVASPEIAVAAA